MEVTMSRPVVRLWVLSLALAVTAAAVAQVRTPAPEPRRGGRVVTSEKPIDGTDDASPAPDRAIAELVAWKSDSGSRILDQARGEHGGTPRFKTAMALLRLINDKPGEALDLLESAATAAPADPAPAYYRGEVLQAQKKQADARTAWASARDRARAAVKDRPKDARSQYYLGAALIRHEQTEPARAALEAAAKLDFDPRMTGYQIGVSRIIDKQWSRAVDDLTAVIELDDRFAPAFFYRGLAWSKLDRKDRMLEDFNRFLALAPSAPEANTARALMSAYAG
jgi:tetratricopeptide (TPR) repeat protein